MKTITLMIIGLLLGMLPLSEAKNNTVCIYFFYGETCPHCAQEKIFLQEMINKYPNIELHSFEVYFNKENLKLLEDIAATYGIKVSGVPTTLIGDKVLVGYAEGEGEILDPKSNAYVGYRGAIERTIEKYINCCDVPCPSVNRTATSSDGNSKAPSTSPLKNKIMGYIFGIGILLVIIAVTFLLLKRR